MDHRICTAIESRRVLEFDYDGLARVIEPHAHGTSRRDNEVVRGFQTQGESSKGTLGWKLFTVEKIEALVLTESTFDKPRTGYVKGDKDMRPVHCEI